MKNNGGIFRHTLICCATILMIGGTAFSAPVVETTVAPIIAPAPLAVNDPVRDAMAIQSAFAQVSRAVEPAVVTITTWRGRSSSRPQNDRGPQDFNGRPNRRNFGNNSWPRASFSQYLQQFQRDYGFAPNKAQRQKLRERFEAETKSAETKSAETKSAETKSLAPKGDILREVQQGGAQGRPSGLGSGLVFRADGYIMTNAHVVSGARMVSVRMNDEHELDAQVVGVDERSDVAVLKVNARDLPCVQLGDSSKVEVGDWAIAIGNPFGLEHTMTVGVISAKAREMPFSSREGNGDYLQTDASINPGNSGGPLCDINGRVIGINNAIYSESGGNVGIGFAIPINKAKIIAEQLVNSGKVTRSYMGVTIATLNDDVADEFKLDRALRGVVIAEIGGDTPAQRAGLKVGDLVQSVNGTIVTKSSELQRAVELLPVGTTANLGIVRAGKPLTIGVRVDALK